MNVPLLGLMAVGSGQPTGPQCWWPSYSILLQLQPSLEPALQILFLRSKLMHEKPDIL